MRAQITVWLLAGLASCGSTGGSGGGGGTPGPATADTGGGSDHGASPPAPPPGPPVPAEGATVRIYVAGESIERRNRFVEAPFTSSGALNERGGGELRNDTDEYGWSVPLGDRLALRYPGLTVEFVGAETWLDADDSPYSGSWPAGGPGHTSAISGTDIPSWLEQRRVELEQKTHCYDVAFAARGGNDFGNDNDEDYQTRLKELVVLLASGSSCRSDPLIVVTAHVPDDQRDGSGDDAAYVATQKHRFVDRVKAVVDALHTERSSLHVQFLDMYTPFLDNRPTTAFPSETWSTGGIPDFAKIVRVGDSLHIRRLASIYIGEIAADALDLGALGIVTP